MEYTDELDSMDQSKKCYLVKFNEHPWMGDNGLYKNESLHGRVVIQTLINGLKQVGWSLLISTDISAKYVSNDNDEYSIDCHSLFLVKTSSQYFNDGVKFDTPAPPSYLQAINGVF